MKSAVIQFLVLSAVSLGAGLARGAESEFEEDAPPAVKPTMLHRYSLADCIERAEQHHPYVAAANARLDVARAQQTEARYAPFFDVRLGGIGGVIPRITDASGKETFSGDFSQLKIDNLSSFAPTVRFTLDIRIPIYTFGKIGGYQDAAEANVRLNEWDREKNRQQVRMDVRRAYFGLQSARDGSYVIREAIDVLEKALKNVSDRVAKNEPGFDEVEKTRLEFTRDDLLIRKADVLKLEKMAVAALRFVTGIQTDFDVLDAPLARPTSVVGPLLQYLTAARVHRPEVNMARAGAVARTAQLKIARARLLPDFALGLSGAYAFAPSLAKQNLGALQDSAGIGIGMQWNLDIVPGLARVDQAAAQLEETLSFQRLALGGIAVEVENQYATVLEARNREERWAIAEHRAKGWLVSVRDAIDLGTKDDRAVTEPLRYYLNSRAEHIRSLFDLHIALSELARVCGWDAVAPKP
jgi:outer membrane protein, multidrug efflux system